MLKNTIFVLGLAAVALALPPRTFYIPQHKVQAQVAKVVENVPVQPIFEGVPVEKVPTEDEIAQNGAAQYRFASNIVDNISDLSQHREEVREGLKVTGMYSYSDGYIKKTVYYEADENGYRVTGEEVEALNGPKINLSGTASVNTAAHGTKLKYTVQSVPADGPVVKLLESNPK